MELQTQTDNTTLPNGKKTKPVDIVQMRLTDTDRYFSDTKLRGAVKKYRVLFNLIDLEIIFLSEILPVCS